MTRNREQVSGTVDAQDLIEAKMRLRAMQIRPSVLSESKSTSLFQFDIKKLNEITIGNIIDLKGIMVFTRQFSSLIDAGVPVVQCLDILAAQEKNKLFKKVLEKVKADVEAGSGLADALSKHPKAFSDLFVRIVEAGELSGTLDKALRRVGMQLEKLGRIRSKVIGALLYPTITIIVAIGVLIFLLVKVIPEISKLYTQNAAKLPAITLNVLALSKWVQDNFYLMMLTLAGIFVGAVLLYRQPRFREVWDPFFIRVPLFGPLIRKASIARLSRTMSTLLSSGVPLLTAFDICIRLMSNAAVRDSVRRAAASVQEGKTIAAGLAVGGIFPPMVIHMVNIGEMTGKLDELLSKVADIYDDEVDDAVGALTGLLQPALIVGVGVVIAFLLLSMYLPIFQLADKMGGGGSGQ
jgi:type IV pilus assembly protein PilC